MFFAFTLIGLFSILENLKGRQRISLFKAHILGLLVCISVTSFFYFLDEIGYRVDIAMGVARLAGTILFINIFFVLAHNKIPSKVIYFEVFFLLIYSILIINGFVFLSIKGGVYNVSPNKYHLINLCITNFLVFVSLIYNLTKLRKNVDKRNLYQLKLYKWSYFLLVLIISIFLIFAYNLLSFFIRQGILNGDTRIMHVAIFINLLLFCLFRPKFIDEFDLSFSKSILSPVRSDVNMTSFEFVFYTNFYYLKQDANLEDFSLKMNQQKSTITEFLNTHVGDNFNNLVNKNRINYFRSLLDEKKHEAFTIEALSEMSGFNNRQSMYNAFKKFVGCTPSAYINGIHQ
jgi:AraC-like DNA-binding protein